MKHFLHTIKSEWTPLRYFPAYGYSKYNLRFYLRRSLILINKELSTIVLHLYNSPLGLLVMLSSIAIVLVVSKTVSDQEITNLLSSVSGFIISFISVLVAAAIFISTLHRQSSNKVADEDIKFQEVIAQNRGTLSKVYEICHSIASDEEKIKLFKSTPCDSVTEYSNYEDYKRWHVKFSNTINDSELQPYDTYLKYPYNTAMSVVWHRADFMSDGCEVAIVLLERTEVNSRGLMSSIKELLVASKRNRIAGSTGYYVPIEFVGQRLYRVVVYSIFALIIIFLYTIFNEYKYDVIPQYNLMAVFWLSCLAGISTIISLYLILRFVFKFISYLRDSTSFYSANYNRLYIYEPDTSMQDPNNSYGI